MSGQTSLANGTLGAGAGMVSIVGITNGPGTSNDGFIMATGSPILSSESGSITVTTDDDFDLNSSASITSATGDIIISATGGGAVEIDDSSSISMGGGVGISAAGDADLDDNVDDGTGGTRLGRCDTT